MPQSLSEVVIHVVFSTKDRRPYINKPVRESLHAYLAVVCRSLGCEAYRVGGTEDHVHIAARLARTISQAELIEDLKTTSSKWMKKHQNGTRYFAWQRGYGSFSIGYSQLRALSGYIDNQEAHHRKVTFQEEPSPPA